MDNTNDSTQPLTWRDVPWVSAPLPRLELVDPLTMSPRELLAYAEELQEDVRGVRELLSMAMTRIVEQRDDLARKRRTIEALRIENQQLRAAA